MKTDQDRPARATLRSGDERDRDPFGEIPGLAPNAGQDVLPHVVTFQGLLRNVARTYYVSDEAVQHSWDNARFMRNDPGIMECLEQRKRSTALLDWRLQAEDESDSAQKMIVDELTAIIKQTPSFLKYRECLLDALWYGKYATSHRYRWKQVNGRMRVVLERWKPVNGDKLVFRYDDGSGEYDDDQVGVRVGAGYTAGSQISNRWKVERFGKIAATDRGLAYFLEHWERPLLAIHKHMIEDAEYEAPDRAGAVHGVGIRSRLYWLWYQKQETLAWLMEYLERSAFGIEIWSYPAGNKEAFEATKKAAQERIGLGRNIVLVPRHPDSDLLSSDVKRIEPGMQGADILDRIIREYFGWQIKRYILGQILTSETASTGLGSGVASIHLDTYLQIIRYDSINLSETLTTDLVRPLIRYNWPKYAEMPIRFVIETEAPDIEGKLSAWQKAYEMGLEIPSKDVADLIGAAAPQAGEEVLKNPQHVQAEMQRQQDQQGQLPTQEEDVRKLFSMLGGIGDSEQYRQLRPGMERIIYHRDGTRTVERYREAPAKSGKGNEPGPEWRTVSGGSRVLISDDGTIMAGCPGLETEDVDEIGEGEAPENRRERDHRKAVAKSKGLEGDELTPEQTKQLEEEPHPEATVTETQQVRFGNREYEVKQERGVWFFRLDKAAGWTMASEETAAAIEEQLDDSPFGIPAEGEGDDDPAAEAPSAPEVQEHAESKINPRTRVGKAILATARDYEIPPDDMADALEYVWERHVTNDPHQRQRALEAARKLTGLYPSNVKALKNAGYDHTSARRVGGQLGKRLAHFDAFAQEIARDFPVLGLGNADDPNADFAAGLWQILDSDRVKSKPIDEPGFLREAAEMVLANRQYDDANVLTATYEEFCRRGEVEKYRQWSRDRYGKKPAKGQMAFQWREEDHPRDADGQFAEKEGGSNASPERQGSLFRQPKPPSSAKAAEPDPASKSEPDSKPDTDSAGTEPESAESTSAETTSDDAIPDNNPDTTPREAASKTREKQLNSEYAYARASAVPNVGEDVLGSARHTRNAWRGLEQAEQDGTAAKLVTREKLLKNEPHNLMVHVTRNPLTALTMYNALKAFPAKPGYGRGPTSVEEAEKNRRQYLNAYQRIKEKAEDLAAGEEDPKKASKALGSLVSDLIREYRGQKGDGYMATTTAPDKYNETANALCALSTKLNSTYKKSSIIRGQNEKFAKALAETYSDLSPQDKMDKVIDHVGDILEGASIAKTFGIKSGGKKSFSAADLYVKAAEREGGPQVPTATARQASEHMLGAQGFRGIQFGNSMTDEERQHHVAKCTEAFADLADVLGIPEEYTSWKGRLAVAFGARGRAGASAHYEPSQQVVNLTRKSGVGALAHEWGHFFDHVMGDSGNEGLTNARTGKPVGPNYMSEDGGVAYEYSGGKKTKVDKTGDPLWKAFDGVRKAQQESGFVSRLAKDLRKARGNGLIGEKKEDYFRSGRERFARCFERYVQKKLESSGRKNTYLAGMLSQDYAAAGMEFWPTDEEVKTMTPAFDSIFSELSKGIEKGKYWLREDGDRVVLERYSGSDDPEKAKFMESATEVTIDEQIAQAAKQTRRRPSDAQKEAGN